MKKKYKLYFIALWLILFSYACSIKNDKNQYNINTIDYKNIIVKKILNSFISSIEKEDNYNYITFEMSLSKDTTTIAVANTIPDLRYAKFQGYDTLRNYTIVYVGEINRFFYYVNSRQEVSREIINSSQKMFNDKRPPTIDPKQWFFYFEDTTLIDYSPKEDIDYFFSHKFPMP